MRNIRLLFRTAILLRMSVFNACFPLNLIRTSHKYRKISLLLLILISCKKSHIFINVSGLLQKTQIVTLGRAPRYRSCEVQPRYRLF